MDIEVVNQNGNHSDDMPLEPSVRLKSYARGLYGESKLSPRVGNHYQVKIPALLSVSEYNSYRMSPFDEENKGGPCDFIMGLPISIIWVNPENESNKDKKVKFLCDMKPASKRNRCYEDNVESSDVRPRIKNDELEEKIDEIRSVLVPGSSGDSWTDIEKASFLLGLYIFRKNFVEIKKFVDTKRMREILCLYHGKFYRTVEYWRWSGCRKSNARKCALGERFFSGLRQKKLLSRLVCGKSDDFQHALTQVSNGFSDKRLSLENYVFSLKNMVGINDLINAVGIGRGKEDLSYNYVRFKGKAFNSLSRSEIIEFLTGDFRLSKARSHDLFWEAVWPILVEKGWNAKVLRKSQFLFAPGVRKSSSGRGLDRLVKGEEYFDSISDVLNLIVSDPGILGLDEKKDNENVKKLTSSRSENVTSVKRKDLEAETSSDHGIRSKNVKTGNVHIDSVKRKDLDRSDEGSSQVRLSVTSSSRDSSMVSFDEHAQVNEPNDRPLFDLNFPAELLDFDCDAFLRNLAEPQNAANEEIEPVAAVEEEGQVNLNSRRQSSRNRQPTGRALEAIAHGLLSVSSRRGMGRGNELGTSDAANGTNSNISGNGEI